MAKQYSNKTSSIARKINRSFWWKALFRMMILDIFVLGIMCGIFFVWCEDKASAAGFIADSRSFGGTDMETATYILTASNGKTMQFLIGDYAHYAFYGFTALLITECVMLIPAIFHTGEIRRKLRPLNDLAVRAEEISSLPMDRNKMEELARAIDHVETNADEVRVSTGDSDLRSIEIALNNLLRRMQEQERQQARFVSDASHELRTPISVIQGYVNMLDRWGKEDETVLTESIEALKNESDHMKELVEQLLFLARGDSGRNTLNFVDFDLQQITQEVWEESLMIDEHHKYVYDVKDMEQAVMVHGDIAMVKQSIRILIQNAAKYSGEGDTIRLAVKSYEGRVAYVVQDEGMGMQAKDVEHIFERFYRSDAARNGSTGGSGLGLSIAKWIVDAHDGTIEVISRPDFGTRFTVLLPAAEKTAGKNEDKNTDESADENTPAA